MSLDEKVEIHVIYGVPKEIEGQKFEYTAFLRNGFSKSDIYGFRTLREIPGWIIGKYPDADITTSLESRDSLAFWELYLRSTCCSQQDP